MAKIPSPATWHLGTGASGCMSVINNGLSGYSNFWPIVGKKHFAAQAIEIRGFRLTPAFPLAYDGNRTDKAE
jgi:hypothetical protein